MAEQNETSGPEPAADDAAVGPPSAEAGENPNEDAQDESKSCRVYVGNLAWEVSWQDLKDLMKTTGHEVTRSDVMKTSDGRSKGCGIVEFATVEGAKEAVLTLNDTTLKGRQIFVREDREGRSGAGPNKGAASASGQRFSSGEQSQSRRVYVGNLSWEVVWNDLKDHMGQAGEVVHAEVICEHNGRSKGCGIVEYATNEEAQQAIATLTHTELKGRTIFVREDRETSSGGAPAGGAGGGGGRTSSNASVYVWNLTYETSWQDLKDHMRKAGNVDQATIMTDADGSSMGCGVVVYQKPFEAARAIRELQETDLKGRQIRLREDRGQPGGRGGGGRGGGRGHYGGRGSRSHGGGRGHVSAPAGTQLFVGNLSYDTNWRDLKDLFKQCGEVDRADTRRGFGTVRFLNKEDAEAAIQKLNGVELDGRALEVRLDSKA